MKTARWLAFTLLSIGCGAQALDPTNLGRGRFELDAVSEPPPQTSLLVLAPGADRARLVRTIERDLRGVVYHQLGARLLVVRVPENADAALAQLGVAQRFERSVQAGEIAGATLEESRFVRVFDNRYYPESTPPPGRFAVRRAIVADRSQPFEEAPRLAPGGAGSGFDTITTPYASGTVVVAILLPESNGVAEPSTEDWTEDTIVETYQKIQTALEAYERSEPNARLRFILHYESAPDHGGLPGTIDSDYEYGQHAQFGGPPPNGADESTVSAALLAKILGHRVASDFDGSYEYLNRLREQYPAPTGPTSSRSRRRRTAPPGSARTPSSTGRGLRCRATTASRRSCTSPGTSSARSTNIARTRACRRPRCKATSASPTPTRPRSPARPASRTGRAKINRR